MDQPEATLGRMQPSARTRLRRQPQRGAHDAETIHAVLDAAPLCHLGFDLDGQPCVLPMAHARIGDRLYVHGALGNRMLRAIAGGAPCCATATLLDGLVLARSAFHHSMNYRCVVVFAKGAAVTDLAEKDAALRAIVDHLWAGRTAHCRPPTEGELRATAVLRLPIEEASAKVRAEPPRDEEPDYALPYWAGVIPVRTSTGTPQPDPRLPPDIPFPER